MSKKNPIAKTLRTPMFKKKVIKPKKGKGSFIRKKLD
jgi:stalled ribosome alternative rescue factor ArfA